MTEDGPIAKLYRRFPRITLMTIAAALIFALIGASPTSSPMAASISPTPATLSTPSPATIYHRAIAAMRAADAHRPAYLIYQLDYTGHNLVLLPETSNGKTDWNLDLHHANDQHAYQIWYRVRDERALTQDRATHDAYRGEALMSPLEGNPLASGTPSPKPSQSPSPSNSGLAVGGATTEVLGSVTVEASRFYDITLVGIENRSGSPAYHLHLHAKSDIPEHPLTDLYVDTATYLVRAAHAEVTLRGVIFALGVAVDIDYQPVGAYWLLDNLHLHGNGYALFYHANMECTMALHDFLTPSSLPDSYFTVTATP